jgi:CheY-like chemotaxis protein
VQEIVRAGERARRLVAQLLAFGRRQLLKFQPVNLNNVLANFENLLRRAIREDVEIQLFPAAHLPVVRADVGQLEQVVMNLAVNAQDAMPDGGCLTIETGLVELDQEYTSTHEEVTPGWHVLLCVSDTGTGMDEATRARVFEPFFTTKTQDKGTGLGLATVYGIVKQHNGSIWVYSEPNEGTTFKVYLPVDTEASGEIAQFTETPVRTGGAETILLAEDDEQVQGLARAVLRREGYTVLIAKNGEHALQIVTETDDPIDLLLTDVIMPDMNGRALYERLAAQQPGLKVLYMSGYTDNVIAHHGVLDAGLSFIQKPFNIHSLARKVREVLDN